MKSKTKKRIAAAVAGVSTLAGLAYALSREKPNPPMFNTNTPFFTEGMDVAVPSPYRPERKKLPATKRMFGTERYTQYKVLGKMGDADYTPHVQVRPMTIKPIRLSSRGGAYILQTPTKYQKSQFPKSATVFDMGAW